MALFILFALMITVVLLLLLPVRVEFQLLLSTQGLRWRVCIRIMSGLARFCLDSEEIKKLERDVKKLELTPMGRAILKASFQQRKRYMWMKSFSARGRVSMENDAAVTALISGGLTALLQTLLPQMALCKEKMEIKIMPEFRFASLWIFMEGMLILLPAKIIAILLKTMISEVKGNVASGRKYHEKHHGTTSADGGR